jgi:hypothetical protein
MRVLVGVMSVVMAVSACRISKIGRDASTDQDVRAGGGEALNQSGPVVQPQRQSAEGPSIPLTLDASGKVQEILTMRLDYFPAPRPDGVSVPTCYDAIVSHLVIGRLYCASNGNISSDVTVSQVNQRCYTATPGRKIQATQALTLPGCQGAAILKALKFEPNVKLEVVSGIVSGD